MSDQNLQAEICRAIQSDRKFPRKPKPDVSPDLAHGWLLPALLVCDSAMYGRWDYWADCALAGELPDAPIPAMDWVDGDTLRNPARKMLEACLDSIPRHGSWQGWSGWQYFDYFLDWLLFGFGHQGQPELPPEPPGCAGASARLYQVFCVEAMLGWPHDYFGDILAENHHGRGLGFYPTPMPVSRLMAMMLGVNRTDTVSDPCCGTGRMLLAASDYSLRLYGQDINGTVIKATLVNGYLYAPWLVRPLPFLDGAQYDPAQSAAISDSLAAVGESRPDVAAYLVGSEHDPELQWRFEPVKKRRRSGASTNVESDAEKIEILQGVLF
ncbi:MAG: hypothetical protein FOGNACKC_06188 [Anaerolineae bacterium]|nr:hypothetical protein [Anaerolineae bacterium]